MGRTLGEFEQMVLYAVLHLREDGAYGVAIRRAIEARTGRDVSPGAVYTTLERLENRELVASEAGTDQERGRPRRYYRLLPAGALELQRSRERVTAMAEGLEAELGALAAKAADGAEA
jgi:PadR family transcriptional regulator PadR